MYAIPTSDVSAEITAGRSSVSFALGPQTYIVGRGTGGALPARYTDTARTCPEHCIEPSHAAPGVATLTELDVLDFMERSVGTGTGLMVDARLPEGYAEGSIPGAISVPAATLIQSNPYREDLLLALGASGQIGQMEFGSAFDLLVFDDGPWSPVAREAIERLLDAGYPAQKISYYRGGLQMWQMLGLTVSQ
ncbi:MAG: rhodanese-like domain-containing protein [Pseudomonadota bacterium]